MKKIKTKIPYHKPLPTEVSFKDIFETGMLTNNIYCRMLESEIKEMYDVEYVLTTSSCTQALMLCLQHVNPDSVQLPMFNWWSDLYVLDFLKINKVWLDINFETWLPIEELNHFSLYLHTFGNIGQSHEIDAIYDASHCLGANIRDFGLATVFSLAPTKLVTACEGGLILTNDFALYKQCKEWRDKMCRMSELNAKTGLETLKSLNMVKDWKKKARKYYERNISGQFQEVIIDSTHNTIGFLNIENLKIPEHIEYKQYYEPIHQRKRMNGRSNTNFVYNKIVCLPSFYGVDYKQIVEDINEYNT